MISYENFEIEDFVHDDFFIESVLSPTIEHDVFWQEWLIQFPERKPTWERARIIVSSISTQSIPDDLSEAEVDAIVAHVKLWGYGTDETANDDRVKKFYQSAWFRIAALLLVFITAGLVFYVNQYKNNIKGQSGLVSQTLLEYKNITNQSKLIRMNDSSLAILMPNSSLKYPKTFAGATREVYLDGQAFFEIHKNRLRPFLVHTQNMVTRVVGTSFTVKAFSKDKEFKVIVNTGKVLVYDQRPLDSLKHTTVTLVPHQQAILKRQQSVFVKDTVATPMMLAKETAKKEFTFNNASLTTVIQKLEMAYHVKIQYDQDQLGSTTLTAALSNLPLDEKVKLICKAINAKCDFIDGQITIEKKQD